MPFMITCDDGNGGSLEKSYPDGALKLCVAIDPQTNTFKDKRVDEIVVGDHICHYPGKAEGGCREVTAVTEV